MRSALSGAENAAEARAALERPVTDGRRGFAFVLLGCAETSAVLLNDHGLLTARLTGNAAIQCDAPLYFLATFEVNPDDVPNPRLTP